MDLESVSPWETEKLRPNPSRTRIFIAPMCISLYFDPMLELKGTP